MSTQALALESGGAVAVDRAVPTTAPTLELTILMPCLNEARTLPVCIAKARRFLDDYGVQGEVLIADNGSEDGSQQIARDAGARVVNVPVRGYGAALIAGVRAARGRYVIMGDADDSYDFLALRPFIDELRRGTELVMGNRFRGGIAEGAMPPLHRYLGNPVLSGIGRLLFRVPIRDFHCGLRGFSRDRILSLNLNSTGMEFASEMVVKASLAGCSIAEVPTTLSPDGRDRPPHLRSWRDGWRHLRFLLAFNPVWLLLYPGLALLALGLGFQLALALGPVALGSVVLDIHTLLYAGAASIVGLQLIIFSLFFGAVSQALGVRTAHSRVSGWLLGIFTLERGLVLGGACLASGLAWAVYSVMLWSSADFAQLEPQRVMRIAIPAVTLTVAGIEIAFASFFIWFARSATDTALRPQG
jgi:glycosyltransferase involved in cell wall biosynthesis